MGAGDLWLRNARVPGSAAPTDIVVRAGRIDTVGDAPTNWGGPAIDARGYLVLPGLVDGHAHVDKTLWGCRGDRTPRASGLLR